MNPLKTPDRGRYRKFGKTYEGKIHLGHDFDVWKDTEVFSIYKGDVLFMDLVNGFGGPGIKGGVVLIRHFINGVYYISLSGHIDFDISFHKRFLTARSQGNYLNIQEGEEIGTIGDYLRDGLNTPHLHFGIWKGEDIPPKPWGYFTELLNWIDPLKFLDDLKNY